jgi:hypothetical protein
MCTMIRIDIQETAKMIPNNERWERLRVCGVHDWQSLPVIDSGEHYCHHCRTLWDDTGRIVNLPTL